MSFDQAMAFVEFHEGGFVDDPDDMGGTTIYGISKRAHPDPRFWANPTPAKARAIYKREYWTRYQLYKLPPHISCVAFDMFVNHNPMDAVKVLQRAARGLVVDGVMGPKTRAKLKQGVSVPRILQHRTALYNKIVSKNRAQKKFLDGWIWRSQCLSRYSLGVESEITVTPSGRYRGI